LPTVWFVTDPERTPDPVGIARQLPRGCGIIYRHFGADDAETTAMSLARIARERKQTLLIGADPELAARVGAAGVHLPERMMGEVRRLKARHPRWIVTVAVHAPRAARRAHTAGADAVLLSTVFPSRSPSAGRAVGEVRLAALVRASHVPILALGGVNALTAARLVATSVAGFAAVDAFR
jgi:thiamine-phosphate pyrophosphorylase